MLHSTIGTTFLMVQKQTKWLMNDVMIKGDSHVELQTLDCWGSWGFLTQNSDSLD